MKKIFLILCAVLFLASAVQAQQYTITEHVIDITIDEEGFALISEKFLLQFPNDFQLKEFRDKYEEIGINLDEWRQFDSQIHTYVGREEEINRAEVSFVENDTKYLEIKYSLNMPIVAKKGETSRMIEFSLINRFLDQFLQGSVWILPEGTTIIIKLPSLAEIQEPVKPAGILTANQVIWQGYKSTNILSLNYRLVKQIASINIQESLNDFVKSPLFIIIVAIIAVIAAIVYKKRKTISEKIENYLIDHSEIGGKEEMTEEEKEE